MTDREEFERWAMTNLPFRLYYYEQKRGNGYFCSELTYAHLAWQARGEIDAVRIKELEADQEGLLDDTQKLANALLAQEKQVAELTAKLDKAKEYLLRILVSDCDFARIDAIANEALEELDK